MWSSLIFLSLVLLRGGESIRFLVQVLDQFCIFEYENNLTAEVARASRNENNNLGCVPAQDGSYKGFDYDVTSSQIYYINDFNSFIIKRLQNNVEIESTRIHGYYWYENLYLYSKRGFAIDWVHDTFYVVKFRLQLLTRSTRPNNPMYVAVSTNGVSLELGVTLISVFLTDVQLDPYEQLSFVLVDCPYDCSEGVKSIILTSDLNGNGLRKSITTRFSGDRLTFSVDVGNMRVYVNHEDHMYIHNYEGTMLVQFRLSYRASQIAVLDDLLFVSHATDIFTYRITLNQSHVQVEHEDTYNLDVPVENFNFKVMDARAQRRKRNGRYICDRTDCPGLCEVRSTGDVCISKRKPLTQNGDISNTCGQSNLTSLHLLPTIVGGSYSHLGDFPWHATLYYTNTKEQFCGGTLISTRAVLTAAHCVTSYCGNCIPTELEAKDIMVSLGRTKRAWNTKEWQITRQVNKVYVNDKYMGEVLNFPNDIALLVLDSKVPVSNFVMPACLDKLNELPPHDTLYGYVAGFGHTEECGKLCSNLSERLKYTKVHVMSLTNCFENSYKINKEVYPRLTTDKFCTGNGAESPIQKGDSGGGITLVYKGLHYLTGVVSVKLANGRVPKYSFGAFTNVSEHMVWLNKILPDDN